MDMNSSSITSNAIKNNEIGGLVFFLTYISEYMPYVTLVSIETVVGIIGN